LLSCIPPHSLLHPCHFPRGTSLKRTVDTSRFELLNNYSKLEAMFLPAALDVAVSYFVDPLCVFLRMRVVCLLYVLACVEGVVLVSGAEVRVGLKL
jgi:hypothetical protein